MVYLLDATSGMTLTVHVNGPVEEDAEAVLDPEQRWVEISAQA